MNVADKLTTIAENQQKVYDAGKQSEYDAFWDNFQLNGNRRDYSYGFYTAGWNDVNFNPKYDIKPTSVTYMFHSSGISDLEGICEKNGIELDFTQVSSFYYFAMQSSIVSFPELGPESGMSNAQNSFNGCAKLKTIEAMNVNQSTSFGQCFRNCTSLTHAIFKGVIGVSDLNLQWSKLLDRESLTSLINILKDYSEDTSGTVWRITLGTDNINKLTDEEKTQIKEKGWTYQ